MLTFEAIKYSARRCWYAVFQLNNRKKERRTDIKVWRTTAKG